MTETLYIYYRVPLARQDAALPLARALLAAVASDTGCQTQLSCRCDDAQTWMETYSGFADRTALLRSIELRLEESGLALLLAGAQDGRRLESFKQL